jgi:lysophospholipase-3
MRVVFLLAAATAGAITPVVIIPGDGGSQLEAKLDKPSRPSVLCDKKANWYCKHLARAHTALICPTHPPMHCSHLSHATHHRYTLWLSVTALLPGAIECWCDNIKLDWNNETETYSNTVGVTTRTPGFGTTTSIESLDPQLKSKSKYFGPVVEALVSAGLTRNSSLRGAPYDFRYGPKSDEGKAYLGRLKALIEETYALNSNEKVALISHSMGCIYALYFLAGQTQAWKDKFIAKWLPTSGAFSGSASEIKLFASGDSEGISGVSGITIREEQVQCSH